MSTLETILLILLVLDAIALGALVLLQQGKGADIGAAFGSGAANAMFGGAGSASFLAKSTAWLTMGFFALSLALAYMAKEHAASLKDIGVPVVNAPASAPADDSTPVPTNSAPTPAAPVDTAPANAPPDSKLTAPGEPVDSSVPNV